MKKLLFLIVGILITCNSIDATNVAKQLVNLRTNYEKNPLGIEETPHFSWEMKAPGMYGASQKAYQIVVAESADLLKAKKYIYNSGKQLSGKSVNIAYKGIALKPCKKYYWKVNVWDETNKVISSSEPAWFETALMNSGWSNAQWIGSKASIISKYDAKALITYDFKIEEESNQSGFIIGYMNKKNYACINIENNNDKTTLTVSYTKNNIRKNYEIQDITEVLPTHAIHQKHSMEINMLSFNYCNGYTFDIAIDGKKINQLSTAKLKNKPISIEIQKANTGFKYARLYGVGFYQQTGQNCRFENIKIIEPSYGKLLYKFKKDRDIKGVGKPMTWFVNRHYGAPMLRKSFQVNKEIKSARLYATARGFYEMSMNGKDVSKDFFNPGWTDYRFRQMYNTFDVTNFIQKGDNVIGAVLGKGFYTGAWGYKTRWWNSYGSEISLMAKLVITYTDNTSDIIVTDNSWKYTDKGPIIENGFQNGEDYDANREIKDWNTVNYDAKDWNQVKIYPALADSIKIQAYIGQPVRVDEVCEAKKMTEPLKNHYIYDMGQNMVGVPSLLIHGKKNQQITVRYAEMLYPDVIPTDPVPPYTKEIYEEMKGQMYIDNYRGALSTDHYICKGDANGETFEPHFTSHGFRYIEITGLKQPLELKDVKVLVLNSLQEKTANYETDNEKVNKLYSNIVWGQKGNFQAVPTDCPQRDERLGWTGDAQIFTRTACYNRNVQPFYNRWLYTLRDDQSVEGDFPRYSPLSVLVDNTYKIAPCGWSEVGVITPWQVYQQYCDISMLQKSYPSMERYMNYLANQAKNYIQPLGGYGDWVALLGTPSDLTNTAYYAYDAKIMKQVAEVLGKSVDAKKYAQLFENIKKAFAKKYLRKDGYLIRPAGSPALRDSYSAAYGTGPKTTKDTILDTQTGYILPLYVGLIDDSVKTKSVAHLVDLLKRNDYKLNTGFIGTPYMNIVLSDNGYDDVAYKMFLQEAYPSWIYPLLQGATTIWERWNSYTLVNGFGPVDMNSFNHYSYGAIQDWMMAYNAGIQRDENKPGYKHIILQPRVCSTLGYTNAEYNTVYGKVSSCWKSTKTDKNADASQYGYTYTTEVPANTTATLILPLNGKKLTIAQGTAGIISKKQQGKKVVMELKSGNYKFEIK